MIKHFFKTALRNLAKQKSLTLINIAGLSIGLACFSLFLLYAINEFSFDRFHKKASNIYRVYRWTEAMEGEDARGSSYMPIPLGPALKQDFPEVKNFVRIKDAFSEDFVRAGNNVSRIKISFADPEFFSVFTFKILYGNTVNPLKEINSVVLTKEKAIQLFGEANAVGKTIKIKESKDFDPFVITAVTENIPANSTIQFDILGNFNYFINTPGGKSSVNNWHRSGFQTYVELREGSKLQNASGQLRAFRSKYYPDEEDKFKKKGLWTSNGSPVTFGLQSLRSMHTNMKIGGGVVDAVNPKNIWILLAIATGILLIACINFTTLAIGRSASRAKEIGVRKVIGGKKRQLVLQFLTEALLLSILSAAIGLLLGKLLLPYFNNLSGRELQFSLSQYPEMTWMLAGLVFLVGLFAGIYPALILSGFRPIEVLKSKVRVGGSNFFTKSLVTVQFILSIGLIISTIIILQQLKYMQNKNPGFDKENIVMVDAEGVETKKAYPLFRQALLNQPRIAAVASAELGLGDGMGWSRSDFDYRGTHKAVYEYYIDPDYINLMGIKLIAGRNFDPTIVADSVTSVIINESMMNDFGWTPQSAIGQKLTGYADDLTPEVIGVVKNFNFLSLSEKIEPQMFQQFHDYAPYKYFVKLKPGNPSVALGVIRKAWAGIASGLPLKYDFLDESLNRFYKSEARWSNVIGWAGGISIFLACLGLFGLTALAVVNKTKEIGIRKVLGASSIRIVGLLSKGFLRLLLIALLIASPLAWYFMNKWLQSFAYRISIGWWVFIIAGSLAIAIALITISFQSIKAAVANPVKSLRSE
ncbi:MAG: ABC transporter permease [Bacteroidetes bacterium]|nr:ABC transporter permease [Bacteroidota bacterium]